MKILYCSGIVVPGIQKRGLQTQERDRMRSDRRLSYVENNHLPATVSGTLCWFSWPEGGHREQDTPGTRSSRARGCFLSRESTQSSSVARPTAQSAYSSTVCTVVPLKEELT